ncbi:hypothetical protein [Anaerotignum sp. MSJ-24]|uniref:antitoxin VbhA family protein n=1 Tax=Anaerotignum sp. MSJ-24 TaxID=2841521 RepID=UPI001C114489|nr:hypothetical protein [Anaerotignum sp. MSJ-24]MBD9219091.1 hypothetical protein [Clostridiales bacterium]MBU5464631.1 hypothetical protein [Anaerotignum sp. MSJ-24]
MSYTVEKKYTIKETTKVIREKIVNDALAISTLDASEPTKETMDLVQEYIDGQKEISEILEATIKRYKIAEV